jgi:hypothetical protein
VVQTSWAPYRANPQQTGTQLFASFLAANPTVQAQFPNFRDVAAADLPTNAALQAHALKIFNIIDEAVQNGNFQAVAELSGYHQGIGQTNRDFFNLFRQYFVTYLNVSGETQTAWNAVLDEFFQNLFSRFQ